MRSKSLRRSTLATIVFALLFSPLAFAQGGASGPGSAPGTAAGGAGTSSSGSAGATRAPQGPGLDRADARFVKEASMANAAEVAAGRVAIDRASSPQVKQFAQRMVDDHTKAGEKLSAIASGKGAPPETAPDRSHQRGTDALAKKSGAEFDRAYMKMQADDHKKAIALFDRQSRSGKDPELKQFATETLPALREHDRMVHEVQSAGTARK